MKIPVIVTQEGSSHYVLEEVTIDEPIEAWDINTLYDLCGKMEWFTGQRGTEQPSRRCNRFGSGYVVTVEANNRTARTAAPLALPEHLATASIWSTSEGTHDPLNPLDDAMKRIERIGDAISRSTSYEDETIELTAELERASPVIIDGEPYALWLMRIEPRVGGTAAYVEIGIRGNSAQHVGAVQVDTARLKNVPSLVKLLKDTAAQIVRGAIPPGTRQLL